MKKQSDQLMTGRDFDRLSDTEKEAIYQECEKITPDTPPVPLTPAQKAQHKRWLGKNGKPRTGSSNKSARRVQISMERALLKAADRFASEHGLSRSQVIEQGVRKLLAG